MPAPPPLPPAFTAPPPVSGEQDRSLLLQSIREGKALRKTVTVDKSAPAISGMLRFKDAFFILIHIILYEIEQIYN